MSYTSLRLDVEHCTFPRWKKSLYIWTYAELGVQTFLFIHTFCTWGHRSRRSSGSNLAAFSYWSEPGWVNQDELRPKNNSQERYFYFTEKIKRENSLSRGLSRDGEWKAGGLRWGRRDPGSGPPDWITLVCRRPGLCQLVCCCCKFVNVNLWLVVK